MESEEHLLIAGLRTLPEKPADTASRSDKQYYSQKMSEVIALALAQEFRNRGLAKARPSVPGEFESSGAERRMAGGVGAKNVDVTWATEESGLLLGVSIKTINFRDRKSGNFQKNVTNRRGDLLMEAVTLHRRFPYAVLAGLWFFDSAAASDDTDKRRSTFVNAHARTRLFTGRSDPAGRDEQFEKLYLVLVDASPSAATVKVFEAGNPKEEISLSDMFSSLLQRVAERNADFYECVDGRIVHVSG